MKTFEFSGNARLRTAGVLGILGMTLGVLADLASGFSTTGTAATVLLWDVNVSGTSFN